MTLPFRLKPEDSPEPLAEDDARPARTSTEVFVPRQVRSRLVEIASGLLSLQDDLEALFTYVPVGQGRRLLRRALAQSEASYRQTRETTNAVERG